MSTLIIVLVLQPVFIFMPMTVIAAILIVSSCRLVPLTAMKTLWTYDKKELSILIATWLTCVFKDGATGLLLGAFLSLIFLARK